MRARERECRPRDRHRLLADGRRKKIRADLPRQRLQLLDRGRTINVGRYQQNFLLVLALDEARELRRRRRLARSLQTGQQNHRRRLRCEIERRARAAHQCGELAVNDPDQRLTRRQRADHLLALRLVADRRDEILDDRQRDVGFEKREAHFAERVGNVRVGEARFAAQRLDDARESFGQIVEHRGRGIRSAGAHRAFLYT